MALQNIFVFLAHAQIERLHRLDEGAVLFPEGWIVPALLDQDASATLGKWSVRGSSPS
jgi:hypothetical protein